VLGLLHGEHDQVERSWIHLLRRGRGKRARQFLRFYVEQRLPTFDRNAHQGPVTIYQLGGGPGADERDVVPGHQQLGGQQRAVGGPQNEDVVFHWCVVRGGLVIGLANHYSTNFHLVIFRLARLHIRAVPSFPPATMKPGSGENRTFNIGPVEPRNAPTSFLLSILQIRTICSSPVEANNVPSRLNSTVHTSRVWPSNMAILLPVSRA